MRSLWTWLRKDYHGLTAFLLLFMAVIFVGDHLNHKFFQTDFKAYLQAAYRMPYGEMLYHREPGEISGMAYKYSPAVVFLFIPLTWVSVEAAKVTYFLITCTVIFLLLRFSRELVHQLSNGRATLTQGQLFIAVLAMGEFIYREIDIGNVNALVALLTIASCWLVGRDRELPAGVLLGLAALFKPHYSIFVLFYLLFRKWRMAIAYLAIVVAGLLAPTLFYGIQGNIHLHAAWWREMVGSTPPGQWIHPYYGMNTLIELCAWPFRLTGWQMVIDSPLFPISVLLLLAVGFILLLHRVKNRDVSQYYPVLYMIGCTPLLLQVDINHFLLLMPLIFYLLAIWKSQPIVWRVAVAAGLILLGGNIFEVWGRELHRLFFYIGVYAMGATLLLTALLTTRLSIVSEPAAAGSFRSRI